MLQFIARLQEILIKMHRDRLSQFFTRLLLLPIKFILLQTQKREAVGTRIFREILQLLIHFCVPRFKIIFLVFLLQSLPQFEMVWWRRTIKTRRLFKSSFRSRPIHFRKFIFHSKEEASAQKKSSEFSKSGLSINKDFLLDGINNNNDSEAIWKRARRAAQRRKKASSEIEKQRCVYYAFSL